MATYDSDSVDLREKLAHIDQMLADHDRKRQEAAYAPFVTLAHIDQMLADHDRKRQEIRLAPWQLVFGGMAAGAAFLAASIAATIATLNAFGFLTKGIGG
jgi:hypothetical protein